MLEKIKKNIFIAIALSGVIYLLLSFYADFSGLLSVLEQFNWIYFFLILLLSYLTFFTRYLKWDYYLRLLNLKVSKIDSYQIFLSSLIMSVTPGKIGDLIKSYMLKKNSDIPISQTAPIILAERITEFLSLILITLSGIYLFEEWKYTVIILAIVLFGFTLLLSNKKTATWGLTHLAKFNFMKKYIDNLSISIANSQLLLKPAPFIKMILLSLVSWIFEGFGFYLILTKLNVDISVIWSFFIYAFSILIGSIAMIPGGLGVTEGSLTYLLVERNVSKNVAVAATFIFRIATLWFAIFVGTVSLLIFQKKIGKLKLSDISNGGN